jgi:hypothetical protein
MNAVYGILNLCVALIFVACLPPALIANDNILGDFPVYCDGDFILVPVTVGEGTYSFVIDTCATQLILDETLRPHTPTSTCDANDSDGKGAPDDVFSIGVGSAMFDFQSVKYADLSNSTQRTGHTIFGILAIGARSDLVIQVDVDNRRLRLLRSSNDIAGDRTKIHRHVASRLPLVTASLGTNAEIVKSFYIDLNARSGVTTLLHSRDFSEVRSRHGFSDVQERAVCLGALDEGLPGPMGVVDCLRIGRTTVHNVNVGRKAANSLGRDILLRYNFTIDLAQDVLILDERRTPFEVFARDRSGLRLLCLDDKIVVNAVDKGSAADMAGVRRFDVLEAIDGVAIEGLRLHTVRRMCCSMNESLTLDVRRREEIVQFTLALGSPDAKVEEADVPAE